MSAPTLHVKFVPTQPIYTDLNTGARMSLAIYEPIFPTDDGHNDWCFLGHIAVALPPGKFELNDPYLTRIAPVGVVIRSDDSTALQLPGVDQKLYTDQGSHGTYDLKIYSFKSGTGQPLGLFADVPPDNVNYGDDPTKTVPWGKLRTVRTDLLTLVDFKGNPPKFEKIWDDSKSGADGSGIWTDISLWQFGRGPHTLNPFTFFATEGYADTPVNFLPAYYVLPLTNVKISNTSNCCWMSQNAATLGYKPLRNICLPATHDSGTYQLQNKLLVDYDAGIFNACRTVSDKLDKVPGIGWFIGSPFEWVASHAFDTIQGTSTAQTRSVLHQLVDGIRGLDLRVYRYNDDFYVGHGLLGPHLRLILMDVKFFLDLTEGEIVFITLGHWTGFSDTDQQQYADLITMVTTVLGDSIYQRPPGAGSTNPNPFDQTYNEIVGTSDRKSKVILTWDMASWPNDLAGATNFWPMTYSPPSGGIGSGADPGTLNAKLPGVYGYYTETEEFTAVQTAQKQQLGVAQANYYPFAAYTTLTPSAENSTFLVLNSLKLLIAAAVLPFIGIPIFGELAALIDAVAVAIVVGKKPSWNTLRELSQPAISGFDALFTSTFAQADGNTISLIYTDFYQETSVVKQAIGLSQRPLTVARFLGAHTNRQDLGNRTSASKQLGPFHYDGTGKFMLTGDLNPSGDNAWLGCSTSMTMTVTDMQGQNPKVLNEGFGWNYSGLVKELNEINPIDITQYLSQGDNLIKIEFPGDGQTYLQNTDFFVVKVPA